MLDEDDPVDAVGGDCLTLARLGTGDVGAQVVDPKQNGRRGI